ncbi:MAG: NIPSNAP family protein [Alphaproteobacteria bacterium]|nr:NIPSNAP family protein [Alphaproteobacteria bacterium]
MFVEQRTYTLQPGKVPEWFKVYEQEGMPVQKPTLGNMVGYFTTEFGPLNLVVHMWGYETLDDRARRRAELMAKPEWQNFVGKVRPLLVNMESRVLVPAPFSPIR